MEFLLLRSILGVTEQSYSSGIDTTSQISVHTREMGYLRSAQTIDSAFNPVGSLSDSTLGLSFLRLIASLLLEILATNQRTDTLLRRADGLLPLSFTAVGVVNSRAGGRHSGWTKSGRSVGSIPFFLSVL